nr:protein m42.1 [Murid betaherpesvirus 8]WPH25228.1 protein m42.1 [Murid betaherpesvirus 8]WPH25361.1 protein m42.1 [Murid betaherpesvirus 8]
MPVSDRVTVVYRLRYDWTKIITFVVCIIGLIYILVEDLMVLFS